MNLYSTCGPLSVGTVNGVRLGIAGFPLGHSISPQMQVAALRACGLQGRYGCFEVPPERFRAWLEGRAHELDGFNLTIPHKERALPYLNWLDKEARVIGAVNTVVRQGRELLGYNTDAPGFLAALGVARFEPSGVVAVVLGTGGAARAVTYALRQADVEVFVAGRNVAHAHTLAGAFGALGLELGSEQMASVLNRARLLVNATPVGLKGTGEIPIRSSLLPKSGLVVDLVYRPGGTRLLREAAAQGLRTQDGIELLVQQGALAFKLWTGKKAPLEIMRRAALIALGEKE